MEKVEKGVPIINFLYVHTLYTPYTNAHIYTEIYLHTHLHTDSYMHICTPHTHIYTYVYIQTYHKHTIPVNVYICVYVCVYIYIYIYTHSRACIKCLYVHVCLVTLASTLTHCPCANIATHTHCHMVI